MNKKNDNDFFGDILDNDDDNNLFENSENIESENTELEFNFENDTPPEDYKPDYDKIDHYDRTKSDIKESVAELKGNIEGMLEQITTNQKTCSQIKIYYQV